MLETGAKSLTPTLWIRTAAGPKTGFGHVRRTCVLARVLRNRCTPLFLLNPDDSSSRKLIEDEHFACSPFTDQLWTGATPAAILIDTRDTSGLQRFIARAKDLAVPVISIHDLGLELLPSDIIIDGSVAPPPRDRFPHGTRYYSGPDYMVLDPLYGRLHQRPREIRNNIQSVFINFGGGDSAKYYETVLLGLKLWNKSIDVTGTPGFVQWGQESLKARDWRPMNFHWESENPHDHLFEADIAITAGGISGYEALCAGTPLLALSYDSLQQITIEKLSAVGACIDLGFGDTLNPECLASVLSDLDHDQSRRRNLSTCGRLLVDGRGAERVARIIRRTLL